MQNVLKGQKLCVNFVNKKTITYFMNLTGGVLVDLMSLCTAHMFPLPAWQPSHFGNEARKAHALGCEGPVTKKRNWSGISQYHWNET